MADKRKLILFGAGTDGKKSLHFFGAENVYCFVDNKKHGQIFCNKPVISVGELVEIAADYDVIITISEIKFRDVASICEQLDKEKIAYRLFSECVKEEELSSDPDIAQFKNIYKGEKCFVVGNGPSLKPVDLDILYEHGIKSFGSNFVSKIFDKTKWRPDFLVAFDTIILTHKTDEIAMADVKHKFVAPPYEIELDGGEGIRQQFENGIGEYHYVKCFSPSIDNLFFISDISKILAAGGGAASIMIQIAAYMGFDKIYLLGVDWTCVPLNAKDYLKTNNHFYDEKELLLQLKQTVELSDPDDRVYYHTCSLRKLDEYSRANGFRVYNATKGTQLDAFELVNFEELFER